jgi:hypothetical protein
MHDSAANEISKHEKLKPSSRDKMKQNIATAASDQKIAQGVASVGGAKNLTVLGEHPKWGPVMKGPRGGSFVMYNGKKYYVRYSKGG